MMRRSAQATPQSAATRATTGDLGSHRQGRVVSGEQGAGHGLVQKRGDLEGFLRPECRVFEMRNVAGMTNNLVSDGARGNAAAASPQQGTPTIDIQEYLSTCCQNLGDALRTCAR